MSCYHFIYYDVLSLGLISLFMMNDEDGDDDDDDDDDHDNDDDDDDDEDGNAHHKQTD